MPVFFPTKGIVDVRELVGEVKMGGNQSGHPARDMLAAYGVGKLQGAEAEAVESHITECEECCETLLDLGSDTFVELVGRSDAVQLETMDDETTGYRESNRNTSSELPEELLKHPRYRVLELLGKGGMGDVYKAEHTLMNRAVALKVINRELVQNAQAVERFRREVQSAAQLAHPNIVTAYDAEQAGDMHLLVMEYVPGDNLSDVVKRDGPLAIFQACDYIQQTAEALQHAHQRGMVHRDIKPHNLMVTSEGQVKILDFGLATLATEVVAGDDSSHASQPGSDNRNSLTSAGSLMGTPDFISPEQASDARAADIRSDVYSLGCTFYYLLTGKPPFAEGSALERVKAHCEVEPELIENVRRDIPAGLAVVVQRMMAKDPAVRFQTPAEVADALAPFVDARQTTPRQETDSRSHFESLRPSWWPPTIVQSIASAAFAFILAGIIYVYTNNGMLEIVSDDEDTEVVIRGSDGLRILDTLTGSTAKRLPSGEYLVDLKGADSDFELSKNRFVLRRGGKVIVRVIRKRADVDAPLKQLSQPDEPQNVEHSITERKRWSTEKFVGAGSISRDGRYLPFVDQKEGNVEIRDLLTGRGWFVADQTKDGRKGGRYARSEAPPIISPDGKRLVFNWYEQLMGQERGFYRLRVSNLDGSQPSDLYQNNEVWPQPFDWSADGQSILSVFHLADDTSQIVLVSAKDGSVRVIKSLDWRGASNMKFSGEARAFVYDRDVQTRRNGPPNHDLYLLDPDRNQETLLVQHPADDRLLGWSADRGTVLFSSDRRGTLDLWSVDVANPGNPTLVKQGMGGIVPIGFDAEDTFYYRRSLGGEDVYVATVDVESGELKTPPRKVSRFREGEHSAPDWSPDGRQLAYVRARNRPRITILTMETEQHREIYPDLRYMRAKGARWSPDGKSFVLDGTDNKGRRAIYQVDAQSGDTKLIRGETETVGRQPEWTPDGRSIVFVAVRPTVNPGQFPFAIRQWNLEAGIEKDIVSEITSRQEPCFAVSPDGKTLAFVTHDKQAAKLNVVPVSGGVPRIVYQEKPKRIGKIEWARDGSHIIVEKTGKNETELLRVSINDGSARPIGLSAKGIYNGMLLPRFHRDGRQIAFTAVDQQEMQSEIWALENLLAPKKEEN